MVLLLLFGFEYLRYHTSLTVGIQLSLLSQEKWPTSIKINYWIRNDSTKIFWLHYLKNVLFLFIFFLNSGLQDQLLSLVVMQERPDLEEERWAIVISSAQMKFELKEIEDRILHRLSTSTGSPVDDIDLIITLEASKVKSEEIKVNR